MCPIKISFWSLLLTLYIYILIETLLHQLLIIFSVTVGK